MRIYRYLTTDTTGAYQFLQALRLTAGILLGIVLVKSGYSTSDVSTFEWFLFVANAFGFFWSMGLKNAFLSYYPDLKRSDRNCLFFNMSILFLLLSILSAVLIYIFRRKLGLEHSETLYPLLVYTVFIFVSGLSEMFLLVQKNARGIFGYAVLVYGGYLFLLGGLAVYGTTIIVLYGLALWAFLRFLFLVYQNVRFQDFRWSPTGSKGMVVFALPLIVQVLLGNGLEYTDGFIVRHFFDHAEFAVFRYGARELPLNTVLISSISASMVPLAVQALGPTMHQIKMRISRLMDWLFPLSAVLILLSPHLFVIAFDHRYHYAALIFNIYLLMICSRVLLPQVALYAGKANTTLMYVSLVEFCLNVALSLLLLRTWGMAGIAFATVLAAMVEKILLAWYAFNKLGVHWRQYIVMPKYLIWSVIVWIAFGASLLIYRF